VVVLTGEAAAPFLEPLVAEVAGDRARVVAVPNQFFGGTTSVTGLLTGPDLAVALAAEPADARFLLPDVCLSQGRFLDGSSVEDLPRPVEVVPTDGASLRRALADNRRRIPVGAG
jgi:NifB/MoaA-like Fe-S oxidoreductase